MDEIQTIAARIPGQIEHFQTEEATKHALIMRFIAALGYDVFDPTEVVPEYTADFGMKKGARVDYAIMQDGKPIILFECKSADVSLDDMQVAQLVGALLSSVHGKEALPVEFLKSRPAATPVR